MKLLFAFLSVALANSDNCDLNSVSNLKDLQAIVKAQAAQQWTRCDYNGKMVSCEEWHKLNARKLPKNEDPNLALP